jgi:hypothetical protein
MPVLVCLAIADGPIALNWPLNELTKQELTERLTEVCTSF